MDLYDVCKFEITSQSFGTPPTSLQVGADIYYSVLFDLCYKGTLTKAFENAAVGASSPPGSIVWSSSNTAIVTATEIAGNQWVYGAVHGVAPGSATVTATIPFLGPVAGTVIVTVVPLPVNVTITTDAPLGHMETGTYTWTANASGGVGSYTYAWERKEFCDETYYSVGTNSATYTESTTSTQDPFWLQVTVTDSLGAFQTKFKKVGGVMICE